MRIFDKFNKKPDRTNDSYKSVTFSGDIKDATVKDPSISFSRPRYLNLRKSKNTGTNNIQFVNPEYDLETLAKAVHVDGILSRATSVFSEQIMKNGYDYISNDDDVIKHIMTRLKEIELLTGISNTEVISTAASQLVTYGNAYIIKKRSSTLSRYGSSYRLYNRNQDPIVGLFVVDATTIQIGFDITSGNVKYYKQCIGGEERYFSADDVIHLHYNKIPGTSVGRSTLLSVLDDVRALRKMEEEAEILGFQYAVPLYLYKVGTDNHPAAPGEVDQVASSVNGMNTYGIMCVPHTHSVETVTNNQAHIDIMPYIEHFKKRIYTGLGVTPVVMGEGDSSNRSTAEAGYIAMQSITKSYQKIISKALELQLIRELVLDAGYDPIKFQYEMRFYEIDIEAEIKKESHVIQKYHANLITFEEARLEMDMDTKINDKDLYIHRVQGKMIEMETEASLKLSSVKNVEGSGSTSTKAKNLTKSNEKTIKAINNPSNQHGKQVGRSRFTKDFYEELNDYKNEDIRKNFVSNLKEKLKTSILNKEDINDVILRVQDRVDRLGTLDDVNKVDFTINSIIDEVERVLHV